MLIILIGFTFITLGIYAIYSYNKKLAKLRHEGIETVATIIKIAGSRRQGRKVFVEYTVGGKDILAFLGIYSKGMSVGGVLTLYIDKSNPEEFIYVGSHHVIIGILFIVMGVITPFIF